MLKINLLIRLVLFHLVCIQISPLLGNFVFIPVLYAADTSEKLKQSHQDFERGRHNGKLLRDKDFSLELTIYETNTPPQFRVYAYSKNILLKPEEVKLNIKLKRLDGENENFEFKPDKDFLLSDKVVKEPHSFDMEVNAIYKGNSYQWKFPSYEGRVKISADAAKAAGLSTEVVGPADINEFVKLTGQIVLNPNSTVEVRARFPGIVKTIHANIGDSVQKDQLLTKIESNGTLEHYNINAPQDGIIISRNTNIGDLTLEKPLFTISDLSSLWAKFHVFPKDINKIKVGNKVDIKTVDDKQNIAAKITYIAPTIDALTQSVFAIAEFNNNDNLWKAGTIVKGDLLVSKDQVPLAVKVTALQKFRDFDVVFAQIGDEYEVRMLKLGRSDGEWVEALDGIKPGTRYVTENSFIIKAELEKDGAVHDH
ncbi:MAG: hypothetical protein BGO43_09130 [Gammaproteobacteria bacterium 39-13]|nr:efflux RND transporter periplasmic adaptor subunit [Gammaproteobacteria bacterium]OJV94081.1 MAG: hypothetical protein BGO43_09130 [Gammaproteobacteria bacterium 39-13]